jgi:hypothetical protein
MTAPPGSAGQDRNDTAGGERPGPGGQSGSRAPSASGGQSGSRAPSASGGQSGSRAPSASGGQSGSRAPSASGGQSSHPGEPSRPPGADLAAGLQRWLIRSSARSMRRELTGQFRRTFGPNSDDSGDIWNTATTEPPPSESGEAPECAWCPVCRAARRIRESGPGLGGQLAGAGDAVAAAVQEALSAFDSVLSMRPRTDPGSGRSSRPTSTAAGEADAGDAGAGDTGARGAGAGDAGAGDTGARGAGAGDAGAGDAAAGGVGTGGAAAGASGAGGAAAATRPESPASGAPFEGPDREPDDRG